MNKLGLIRQDLCTITDAVFACGSSGLHHSHIFTSALKPSELDIVHLTETVLHCHDAFTVRKKQVSLCNEILFFCIKVQK